MCGRAGVFVGIITTRCIRSVRLSPLVFFHEGVTIDSGPIHFILVHFNTGLIGGLAVFDSLSDRIKQDEQFGANKLERCLRWGLVVLLSFMLFGGLYLVVQKLE